MAYCSDNDIRMHLANAEEFLRGSEVDFSGQIAAAQNNLDPELRALGYDVPFADGEVPGLVRVITALRAAMLLIARAPDLGDWYDRLDRQVQRLMKQLGTGESELPDESRERGYTQSATVNPHGTARRFTREKFERL